MEMQRGMRDKLAKYLAPERAMEVELSTVGSGTYDYAAFGLDAAEKLSDDRYMVFYNQPKSPEGALTYREISGGGAFSLRLQDLPGKINKVVFTVSLDGNGTMGEITSHRVLIKQDGQEILAAKLSGQDFQAEKAIISLAIYRKGEWRFQMVARGFNGGLGDLLRSFGGEEAGAGSQPAPPPVPPVSTVKASPVPPVSAKPQPQKAEKVSLKKGQKISLTKNDNNSPIIVENGWTAKGKDYDLKALVRYRDGRLIYVGAANDDEVLITPEGAIKHGGDVKNAGDMERIEIKWHKDIASVAVSSYSALENGTGSFREYGVFVRITNGKQIVEIPAASTSATYDSYTLCFGEILFGQNGGLEVSALEKYSASGSERRIGYQGDTVVMDIGPVGKFKGSIVGSFFKSLFS
ncbi:MAG: TerD family protein [Selenomonadaceae bacterium]|nr:TerD family protein [Selenomonadaceae bacterium]